MTVPEGASGERGGTSALGRLFSLRVMLGVCAMSVGVLTAVPLAEHVFGPLMEPGGSLVANVGTLIGVGAERGMALIYIISGISLVGLAIASLIIRPIWRIEDALPDQDPQPVAEAESEPQSQSKQPSP